MSNWTPKRIGNDEVFTCDFRGGANPKLGVGETITPGTEVWSVVVAKGEDANPSAMLTGSSSTTGDVVSHMITGGVVGVIYHVTCTVRTSSGQNLTLPEISLDHLTIYA